MPALPLAARRSAFKHLRHISTHRRTPEPASPALAALLAAHAQHPPRPLTLGTLLSFGHPLTPDSVLESVAYAQAEIPRRLAMRIRSLEGLPFIVGTNPHIARILDGFRASFATLARWPAARTLAENARFVERLDRLVQDHANDIPSIAKGFQECVRYMSPEQSSSFVDAAIHNRIAVRLIAEQHVALTHALARGAPQEQHYHDGIVDMRCSPAGMIKSCSAFVGDLCEATLGAAPSVVVDGDVDATFAYVPSHLEYILTEILKNAFRATAEHHHRGARGHALPPVAVTIVHPARTPHLAPPCLFLRVRDEGGGVARAHMPRIFAYSFTTAGRGAGRGGPYAAEYVGGGAEEANLFSELTGAGVQSGLGTIAGLGFGLPMSRLYARYFGGALELYSLDGWGTDVLLKLRCLDSADQLEI